MINWLTNELLLRKLSAAIPSVSALAQPARRSLESGLKNYLEGRNLRERHYRQKGVRVPAVFSLQMDATKIISGSADTTLKLFNFHHGSH